MCMCSSMCMWVYTHSANMHAHVEAIRQHQCLLQLTPQLFLTQGLLLSLKQIDLVRLASQQAQGILLSLPPKLWDYRHVPPFLASLILGIELRSSYCTVSTLSTELFPQKSPPHQHTFDSFLPRNPEICSFGKCLMPDLGSL